MTSIAPVSYLVKAASAGHRTEDTTAHDLSSSINHFLGAFEDKTIVPQLWIFVYVRSLSTFVPDFPLSSA